MVYPVIMYRSESWTTKKVEHRRTDALKLWCWRRLFRVSWTARKGNQPWIFIGRTDAEAEAPILWPPDGKSWLIGKDHDAGKDWGQEEKGAAEDDWLDSITDSVDMSLSKFQEIVKNRGACSPLVAKSRTRLSIWTTTNQRVSAFYLSPFNVHADNM